MQPIIVSDGTDRKEKNMNIEALNEAKGKPDVSNADVKAAIELAQKGIEATYSFIGWSKIAQRGF